jgi:hypothetical protein
LTVGDAVICLCLAHVAPALLALLDGGGKKGAKNVSFLFIKK